MLVGLLLRYVKVDVNGDDVLFEDSKYWEVEGEDEDEGEVLMGKEEVGEK